MRFRFWTIGAALAGTLFAAAFAAGYANPVAPAGGAFDDANRGRALAPLGFGATVRALFGAAGRMARRPEGRDGAPARRRVRVRQHARLCGRAPGGRRPHACRRVLDRPDRRDDRAVRRVRAGDRLRDRGRAAGRGGRVPCADARRDEHARSCLVVVGEGRVVASPARAGQRHRRAGNLPVTLVTQRDALAYARWLGRDLPTEAEWEYAGKAGRDDAALDAAPRDAQGAGRELLAGRVPGARHGRGRPCPRPSAATRRTGSGSTT